MSVKGGLYMLKVFKNEKLWCAVAGAAAVIENMTGLTVADVNIRVAGVDMPEEE